MPVPADAAMPAGAEVPAAELPRPNGFPEGFGGGTPGEDDAILVLRCLPGMTPRHLHELLWREGSAVGALGALRAGRTGSAGDREFAREARANDLRARVTDAWARFARPGDPEYSPAFERLDDPPIGLFLRGRPLRLGDVRVAVVGSRRPSALGIESARTLAQGLARAGVIVVSGGAIGIDARAHEGALDVGAPTIAVLGSGIDVEYPSTNRELLREIARQGTLVSEYPPGAPALPYRFPARNRVIAGLCLGVVVVEGVAKSGTRSTADYATQIGAEVFAVPGPVTSPLSDAPHELIRDGARLIRGADDLLADLHIEPGSVPVSLDGLPAHEHAVFLALAEPLLLEAAADASGLSIGETLAALMQLEIKALVRGSGGRYRRAIPPREPEDVEEPSRPMASAPNSSEAHGGSA